MPCHSSGCHARLSSYSPHFNPRRVHRKFVVEKVALVGDDFVRVLRFSPVSIIPPALHTHPSIPSALHSPEATHWKTSPLFWDVMQRIRIVYRNFVTASRSQSQRSSCWNAWPMKMAPMPETSINNYPHTLRNIPEEHRPQLHRGVSLNYRTVKKAQTRIHKSPDIYLVTVLTEIPRGAYTEVFLCKAQSSAINVKFRNVLMGPLGGCSMASWKRAVKTTKISW
jgi:hypothetical protein